VIGDPDGRCTSGERLAHVLDVKESLNRDGKTRGLSQKADVVEGQIRFEIEEVAATAALGIVIAGPDPRREWTAEPNELIAGARSERWIMPWARR
jgi:hypothetical protein